MKLNRVFCLITSGLMLLSGIFPLVSPVVSAVIEDETQLRKIEDSAAQIVIQQSRSTEDEVQWQIDLAETATDQTNEEFQLKLEFEGLTFAGEIKLIAKDALKKSDAENQPILSEQQAGVTTFDYQPGAWLTISMEEAPQSSLVFETTQASQGELIISPLLVTTAGTTALIGEAENYVEPSLLNEGKATTTTTTSSTEADPPVASSQVETTQTESSSEEIEETGTEPELPTKAKAAAADDQATIITSAPLMVKDAYNNRLGIGSGSGVGAGQEAETVPLTHERYLDVEKTSGRRVFNAAAIGGSGEDESAVESSLNTTEHPFKAADTSPDTVNLTRFRKAVTDKHYRGGQVQTTKPLDFSRGSGEDVFTSYIYIAEYTEGLTFFMRPEREASSADYYDYLSTTSQFETQGLGSFHHGSKSVPTTKTVTGIQDAMIVAFDNWSNDGSPHLGSDSAHPNSETKGQSHLSIYKSGETHLFKPELDNDDRDGAAQRRAVYAGNGYFTNKWFQFTLSNPRANHATITIKLVTTSKVENLATFDVDLTKYIDNYQPGPVDPTKLVWGYTATMDTSLGSKSYLNRNMIFFSDYSDPAHTIDGQLTQNAFRRGSTESVERGVVKQGEYVQQEATFQHTYGDLSLTMTADDSSHGIKYAWKKWKSTDTDYETVQTATNYPIEFEVAGKVVKGSYDSGTKLFQPTSSLTIKKGQQLKLRYVTKVNQPTDGTRIMKTPILTGSYTVQGYSATTTQFTTDPLQYSVTSDSPPEIAWDDELTDTEKRVNLDYDDPKLEQALTFYLTDKNRKNEQLKLVLSKKFGEVYNPVYTTTIANPAQGTVGAETISLEAINQQLGGSNTFSLQVYELDSQGNDINLRSNVIYLVPDYQEELRLYHVPDLLSWETTLKASSEILKRSGEEPLRLSVLDTRNDHQQRNWHLSVYMKPEAAFQQEFSLLWRDPAGTDTLIGENSGSSVKLSSEGFQETDPHISSRTYGAAEGVMLKTNPQNLKVQTYEKTATLQWQLYDVAAVTE